MAENVETNMIRADILSEGKNGVLVLHPEGFCYPMTVRPSSTMIA